MSEAEQDESCYCCSGTMKMGKKSKSEPNFNYLSLSSLDMALKQLDMLSTVTESRLDYMKEKEEKANGLPNLKKLSEQLKLLSVQESIKDPVESTKMVVSRKVPSYSIKGFQACSLNDKYVVSVSFENILGDQHLLRWTGFHSRDMRKRMRSSPYSLISPKEWLSPAQHRLRTLSWNAVGDLSVKNEKEENHVNMPLLSIKSGSAEDLLAQPCTVNT